jgi:hypothetical protein
MKRRSGLLLLLAPCVLGIAAGAPLLVACGTVLRADEDPPNLSADASGGSVDGDGSVDGSPTDATPAPATDGAPLSYRDEVVSDGPLVYYRFEEAAGSPNAADEMNRHPAIYEGPPAVAKGLAGGGSARTFTGTKTRVTTGPHDDSKLAGIAPMSLEAWISSSATDAPRRIIVSSWSPDPSGPNGAQLLIMSDDLLFERANNVYAHVQTPNDFIFPADEPRHVVAVYDNAQLILYVDGEEKSRTTSMLAIDPALTQKLTIGAGASPDFGFVGVIDEVAIYAKALTPARIKAHYDARDR